MNNFILYYINISFQWDKIYIRHCAGKLLLLNKNLIENQWICLKLCKQWFQHNFYNFVKLVKIYNKIII